MPTSSVSSWDETAFQWENGAKDAGLCGQSLHNWGQAYANLTDCEYTNRSCGGSITPHIQSPRSLGRRRCIFAWQSCPTAAAEPDETWARMSGKWLFAKC